MWLDRVEKAEPGRLDITWKSFSLEQVNSKNGPEWKVWDQPDSYESRSLLSLRAGEAAKLQGRDAFARFHLALLIARHGGERRISLGDRDGLVAIAREEGLDIPRFETALDDRGLVDVVARDHTEAVDLHGVFGTPTFMFAGGASAYLKAFIPPEEDSVEFFDHFVAVVADRSYVGEIKRPQPPWPKGAV